MDSLQHWSGCFFGTDRELTEFLSKNRERYGKQTKFIELERAFFFKLFLDFSKNKIHLVGLPTLDELKKRVVHRLQVVRFTGAVETSTHGLLNFLKKKKFNISKDEKLILLVVLETKGFQWNYIELFEELLKTNVPYGEIFILGRAKKSPDSLAFFCYQVFPMVKTFGEIDFDKLLGSEDTNARRE